ncbi:unnamed protein product [Closterium sp. NIES-53]
MYLMTCTRPDLAYPLSLLARYVAPGRHRKVHWDAAKRVLRYLCSTSGMGLVLGGRGPVVLTVHANASWVDDSATQRSSQGYTFSLGSGSVSWRSTRSSSVLSSSCEAGIYTGAMAAQELRWLTYLLTDLGEQPRSPPRGQLRLTYMATRANTADIFTKALPPGDHRRFSTVLGLRRSQDRAISSSSFKADVSSLVAETPRRRHHARRLVSVRANAAAAAADSGEPAGSIAKGPSKFLGVEVITLKKIIPLGIIFFCILFNYTILRDTKDVLVVTAPGSGAEIIPFLKTWVNLPMAIGFMLLYGQMANVLSKQALFYTCIIPFQGKYVPVSEADDKAPPAA